MKRVKYVGLMLVLCLSSYMLMGSYCKALKDDIYVNANIKAEENRVIVPIKKPKQVEDPLKDIAEYIKDLTKLTEDESRFLVEESETLNVNPFIVLGLIKRESNFDPKVVGAHGERGLGQIMENTAVPVSSNLGIEYDAEKMFDPKYNLKLTITQLGYLHKSYEGDINKTLTAYNRGQQGLINYIEQGRSVYENPAKSDYSVAVLKNALKFEEEFVKNYNKRYNRTDS